MKIYDAEKSIASKISNDRTIAYASVKLSDPKPEKFIDSMEKVQKDGCNKKMGLALAKIAVLPHPDLMYGTATLVSTTMNGNDDVFLPEETWKARATPVNTSFNNEHKELDIIGHIIASRVVNDEGNVIEGDTAPEHFNIDVDFVVYKDIFPAVAKEIAEKAPEGKKFVSMECRFEDFDYALIDGSKNGKVIARNEETSFLTKHLRAYGGDGNFENYKVGRVLRSFRFSGMGNVDIPANANSEYKEIENFDSASVSTVFKSKSNVVLHITKGKIMTIENLEQANKVIADLTNKVELLEGEKKNSEVEKVKAELKKVQDDLTASNAKSEMVEKQVAEANKLKDESVKALETAKADLKAKTEELEKLNKVARATERYVKLTELGIELTDDKRTKYADMSDESFASILEFAEAMKKDDKKKKDDAEDKKDKGKDENKETAADHDAVAKAEAEAKKNLDAAKANKNLALENTSGNSETDTDKVQKAAASLVQIVRKLGTNARVVATKAKKD